MSKTLYNLLNFFLAFSVVTGLFHGLLYWQLGPQMFGLDAFLPWFSALNLITIASTILMLKYFFSRKYMAIFYTGIAAILLHLCYIFAVYKVLISGQRSTFSSTLMISSILANIVYASAVLFANIKNQHFLKASAFTALFISMFHVIRFISPYIKLPLLFTDWSENSESLIMMISVIPSLLLIVHFVKQRRLLLPVEIEKPSIKRFQDVMLLMLFPEVLCTTIFGVMIAIETSSTLYWKKRNDQQTSALLETFETRRFTNKQGEILRYRLLKPLNYDSTKRYPLVISLPYGGQPATDTIRQTDGAAAAEMLSVSPYRENYKAFIFVPNCPPKSGWGGIPNYPSVDALVYEAIIDLDDHFSIDKTRRYVTGISRGGYGAWQFISTRPDLFAAAIPVCGGGNPNEAAKAVNVAVWAFHGTKDKNVPVSGSRDMINAIIKAGGNPKYTEFNDKAHNIWNEVKSTPGLIEWLFEQKQD